MNAPSIAETVRRFFEARDEAIVCVYLFGSVARGTAGPASDIVRDIVSNRLSDLLEFSETIRRRLEGR